MTMSHLFRDSMSNASFRVVSFFACAGALPPALEVEKNIGSIRAKSPSACMRSIRTESSMPRQPTSPSSGCCPFESFISSPFQKLSGKPFVPRLVRAGEGRDDPELLALGGLFRNGRDDRVAYFAGADLLRAVRV